MRVLVTGGCGFIGHHLVNKLVDLEHEVLVIDLLPKPIEAECNEKATYFIRDIVDFDRMYPLFKDVECVFHLAAESRIPRSIKSPQHTTHTNVNGTVNVLECCRSYNIKNFINSSSSSVYGLTEKFPTPEYTPTDCLNPYAATKLAAEEMIRCYAKIYNLSCCSLRYFNVFGEESPVDGPYSLVTGIFLQQYANGKSLTVVGDGSAKRDFVYVGDVVDANIRCMQYNGNGDAFNIGSGKNITVLEIAQLLSDNIEYVPARLGEAKTTLADYSRAKNLLGWKPKTFIEDWLPKQTQ